MNNLSQPYFNDIMVVCFINGGKHVPRLPGETDQPYASTCICQTWYNLYIKWLEH
jgi:hypothetical protein